MYENAAVDLRISIATLSKQLCTKEIDDVESIAPVMACRLISFAKSPCVRPIGIGEVLRRIGKAVMSVLRKDILEISGHLQICAGNKVGCEIAVRATMMTLMVFCKLMQAMYLIRLIGK